MELYAAYMYTKKAIVMSFKLAHWTRVTTTVFFGQSHYLLFDYSVLVGGAKEFERIGIGDPPAVVVLEYNYWWISWFTVDGGWLTIQ